MKTLMKTLLALCLIAGLSSQANAALITQELIEVTADGESVIGSVSIDTSGAVLDPEFGTGVVGSALRFEMLGYDISAGDIFFFEAVFDSANWFAGLEFLSFDINFVLPGRVDWAVDGNYDVLDDPSFNYFSVFNNISGGLVLFNQLALGRVSVVSEPGTIALFGAMLGLLAWRRKSFVRRR